MNAKKVTVKLIRSVAGCNQKIRQTVRGLGLYRLHQVRELVDSAPTRGMVEKVKHLVQVID